MFGKLLLAMKNHKKGTIITGLTLAAICAVCVYTYLQLNFVTIFEDGREVASFTTFKEVQSELLEEAALTLGEDDAITMTDVKQEINIEIFRAFPVRVQANGEEVSVNVLKDTTVRETLDKAQVEYDSDDKFSAALDTMVTANMDITVVRCETKVLEETESIPFDSETKKTDSLYKGVTKVEQEGEKGEKTLIYSVSYEDGVEVSRTLTDTVVTKEAKNKVTLVGTKKRAITSTSSYGRKMSKEELAGARCITVTATAYSSDCDGGARTCLGKTPCYGTVAVDPSVIPLGTKMYIVSPSGNYVYGYCFAGDTGGAIKGNKVDLFMNSSKECRNFGRRTMLVYILD